MSEILKWTDERLAQLKDLWNQGLSISQIGEKMGVSRNAIAGKVHRMQLPKRSSPISKSSKPAEVVVETEELPLRRSLRKIKWSRSKCAWPSGDPKTTEFSFCGAPILAGKPYCPEHCEMAYTTSRDGS